MPDDEGFDPLESLDLDSAGANFDAVHVGGANSSATAEPSHSVGGNFDPAHVDVVNSSSPMDTSHSLAAAGISSGSEPHIPLQLRSQSPPSSR